MIQFGDRRWIAASLLFGLWCATCVVGCGDKARVKIENQVVDAACGECQFGMEGTACDLAIRIDGVGYFVDGAKMDDHGDAHATDGMCNLCRQARVSGSIRDGRFVASSFELLPVANDSGTEGTK